MNFSADISSNVLMNDAKEPVQSDLIQMQGGLSDRPSNQIQALWKGRASNTIVPLADQSRKTVDTSKMNFISAFHFDNEEESSSSNGVSFSLSKSIGEAFPKPSEEVVDEEKEMEEWFPPHKTRLMDEGQHWGCFYIYPDLYDDSYSPVVPVRKLSAVPELVDGVLTRDLIAACLTYLKRSPILGDFVYIKLNLSGKLLMNIEVLQHYKYLVYLDLSSNMLTELNVLSHLLYLQRLNVNYNRLTTVLEYETPQWFLTDVSYKFNSVKHIQDLTAYWSITILDLSHNIIKNISGLQNLRYLRRLDLSFNHIQRVENLNNLNLLWLDLSYNNLESFEIGPNAGLWTLRDLKYLNLNENKLTSLKILSGCCRLQEFHARNNRIKTLLDLAVYLRQLKKLLVLDLRENPVSHTSGYKEVVMSTFPLLLFLDAMELDPVDQRLMTMSLAPDVKAFASRRLLRLLYIEQLSRAQLSPFVPPGDTTEVPIVVLIGSTAMGKGSLVRRLAQECSSKISHARQHTTSRWHSHGGYIEISRAGFDQMLLDGDFLTYTEIEGESYGLSREEAFIKDGRVKLASMDLPSALMLKFRGRRPYMILATCSDKAALLARQAHLKAYHLDAQMELERETNPLERTTLQVLVSGRILVTGIINEILLALPEQYGEMYGEDKESKFVMDSKCSLLQDSDARQYGKEEYIDRVNLLTLLSFSATSMEETASKEYKPFNEGEGSLCSLFKETESNVTGSYAGSKNTRSRKTSEKKDSNSILSNKKGSNVPNNNYAVSTKESKSESKSVTFTSNDPDMSIQFEQKDVSGLFIEPLRDVEQIGAGSDEKARAKEVLQSISMKIPEKCHTSGTDDMELWLNFLRDTGVTAASDIRDEMTTGPDSTSLHNECAASMHDGKTDDAEAILNQLAQYRMVISPWFSTTIRDDYENIHRECPGMFWDVVSMDDPEAAFVKMKKIIRNIVRDQPNNKPMMEIDFCNMDEEYPYIRKKVEDLSKLISPQRFFF